MSAKFPIIVFFVFLCVPHLKSDEYFDLLDEIEGAIDSQFSAVDTVAKIDSIVSSLASAAATSTIPSDGIDESIRRVSPITEEGVENLEAIWIGDLESIELGLTKRDFLLARWIALTTFSKDPNLFSEYLVERSTKPANGFDLLLLINISAALLDLNKNFQAVNQDQWLMIRDAENPVVRYMFFENAHLFIKDDEVLNDIYLEGADDELSAVVETCERKSGS